MYRITKQYGRGPEIICEEFKVLSEARMYAEKEVAAEAIMKVKVKYRIYEFGEIFCEYDSSESDFAGGGLSGGKSSGFRPTPLNSSPRPAGLPHNWLDDEEGK